MTQQTSPFLEGKFGWDLGESNWNLGMDENLLKFSYLFDRNIDGIVSSLPVLVNGTAYFNTTDDRIYYAVGGVYYNTPTPKWFVVTDRTTGQAYQFDGSSLVALVSVNELNLNLGDTADTAKGDALLGVKQPLTGSIARTQHDKNLDVVSVKDFGAVGDSITDDRLAIIAADASAAATGKTLYFPSGTYRSSNGIIKTAKKWVGSGAPVLGVFPQRNDDKEFMRPGYKDKLPGSSILFTGTGSATSTTQRSDGFSSFTYAVKSTVTGGSISGMAIVCDVDVLDAGGSLTAFGSDNTASYDVGYVLDDAARCYHNDFVVFGYFAKAGIVVRTLFAVGTDDPDYNVFVNGSTMGKFGLALIGSESNDGFDSGLSGTNLFGFNIYSMDHHSRSDPSFATADTWRCLYIDGFTDAVADDINGNYFFGGAIRTYAIQPLELNHASNVGFTQTIFELPNGTVVGKNDSKSFVASANTNDVCFSMCRFSLDPIYISGFAGTMSGKLTCVGQPHDGLIISEQVAGTIYSMRMGASGGTGDPAIQFLSGSPSSSTNGWVLRRDISDSDVLDVRWNDSKINTLHSGGGFGRLGYAVGPTRTIASGVITISDYSYYRVANEAAAASDDLDTINGGIFDGQILILAAASSSQDVVIKDATGNIRLPADFTLSHAQDRITLQWDGATWNQLSSSDNTA